MPNVCNCTDPNDPNGQRWIGHKGENAILPCIDPLVGNRTWFCKYLPESKYSEFDTTLGPDESGCINKWAKDIIDNFNKSTASETTQSMNDALATKGKELSAGGIIQLSGLQPQILAKRRQGGDSGTSPQNFTMSFLSNTDMLLDARPSWSKLNDNYETTNNLLKSIPQCGLMFLNDTNSDVDCTDSFEGANFQSQFCKNQGTGRGLAYTGGKGDNFDDVTVFVPAGALQKLGDTFGFVGSSLWLNNSEPVESKVKRFPTDYYKDGNERQNLTNAALISAQVGLTLTSPIKDLEGDDRITITFSNPSNWVLLNQ